MLKTLKTNYWLLLTLLIVGTFVLRLVGVLHSFPAIYHPDEPTIVRSALGLRFGPNPNHFDWPHLYVYVNYFAYMGFAWLRELVTLVGLRSVVGQLAPIIWNEELVYYLLTRIISITLASLTLLPVYLTGKKLFGEVVGLLGAATFAVFPFHIWHSQYTMPDVPMTFLLSWSVYFAAHIMESRRSKYYILAGLFAGLAASTKYNGGLVVICILLAHLIRVYTVKSEKLFELRGLTNLVYAGVFTFFGFVLGTPFFILDFKTFTRTDGPQGALWQFKNVGSVSTITQIKNFFKNFYAKLPDDFGFMPMIFYLGSVLWVGLNVKMLKTTKEFYNLLYLILPSVFCFFYLAGFSRARSHYFFVAYPFVAILAGYFLHKVLQEQLVAKRVVLATLITVLYFAVPLVMITYNNLKRVGYVEESSIMLEERKDYKTS